MGTIASAITGDTVYVSEDENGETFLRDAVTGKKTYKLNGFGATPITTIPSASTAVTLEIGTVCNHTPTAAVTYTLPTPTDTTVDNRIILDVDMTNMNSITFNTGSYAGGMPSFTLGDKWSFVLRYIGGRWVIYAINNTEAFA